MRSDTDSNGNALSGIAPPEALDLPGAFDAIVAGFYRAATGEIAWGTALDPVQAAFGARGAVLHTLDMASGRLLALHVGGVDVDEASLTYVRDFHTIDPRRLRAMSLGPDQLGQWSHCHEYLNDDFVAADRFFQHYLPAYDMRFNSNIALPMAEGVMTAFILELPSARGVLSADERELARRLGLHMQEALRAHERVRRLAAQALAGHGLLHGFAYPMWLIDAERRIYFANPAAERETGAQTRVAQRGARLLLAADDSDRSLGLQLRALDGAAHGASAVVSLASRPSDAPAWLHLSVLIPGAVLGVFGDRPLVLATLFDPLQVSSIDPYALAECFGLTPAEARVAARLADGLTAEQVARVHGTRLATVRTQIARVMHKLGCARSADVVRLLRQSEALWAQAGDASR